MQEPEPNNPSLLAREGNKFEIARRGGQQPRIEDYLGEAAHDAERDELLRHLVRVESQLRRQGGEQPAIADYESRFPALASWIEALLDESPVAATAWPTTIIANTAPPLAGANALPDPFPGDYEVLELVG